MFVETLRRTVLYARWSPTTFAHPVRAWLDDHFTGRWIGRRGKNSVSEISMLFHAVYCLGLFERGDMPITTTNSS